MRSLQRGIRASRICRPILVASLLIAAIAAQDRTTPASPLFGTGYGLDHLIVLVRDLDAAKATYGRLGFAVPPAGEAGVHPVGTKNSTMRLANATYLELLAMNDGVVAARERPEYVAFLAKHEGAFAAGIHVSSAESTAARLRELGIHFNGPEPGTVVRAGRSAAMPPPSWWLVKPDRSTLPGDPIFFVDYLDRRTPDDRHAVQARYEAAGRTRHANTAKHMAAIWVAVRELDRARRAFEAFGLRAGAQRVVSTLGARGQEIEVGSGVLLLLQPTAPSGGVASFLAGRGEGVMGVSLEVEDLAAARQAVRVVTAQPLKPYTGAYGSSILIPGNQAHGVWIECFQR